jgi:hypothetical protein
MASQLISSRQLTWYSVFPCLIPMGFITAGVAQAVIDTVVFAASNIPTSLRIFIGAIPAADGHRDKPETIHPFGDGLSNELRRLRRITSQIA